MTTTFEQFENKTMCTIITVPPIIRLSTDIILQIQVLYSPLSLLALSTSGIVLVTTTFEQFENKTMCTIITVPRILRQPTDIIRPIQVLYSRLSLLALST